MTKIAINREIGGFTLSYEAAMRYAEIKGLVISAYRLDYKNNKCTKINPLDYDINDHRRFHIHYLFSTEEVVAYNRDNRDDLSFYPDFLERDDPILIQVIEELGCKASVHHDDAIKVVEIPDDVEWWIDEDEMGPEVVREKGRCWY